MQIYQAKEILDEDDKVEQLCDEFWEWRMRESPEFASYCGDQRYCDQLDDIDTAAFQGFEVSCNDIWFIFAQSRKLKSGFFLYIYYKFFFDFPKG